MVDGSCEAAPFFPADFPPEAGLFFSAVEGKVDSVADDFDRDFLGAGVAVVGALAFTVSISAGTGVCFGVLLAEALARGRAAAGRDADGLLAGFLAGMGRPFLKGNNRGWKALRPRKRWGLKKRR